MKLFINDIPVEIINSDQVTSLENFDVILDCKNELIEAEKLYDDVLIKDASMEQIDKIIKFMRSKKLKKLDKKLDSITFSVKDIETAKIFIKSQFTIIKAAGGVVQKDDKILLIYRLDKWDLPKGKLDKKENTKDAAVREVEEECNIKVSLDKKICSTWHTYTRNGKRILKKTSWYAMDIIDDSKMKPQAEEDIQEVRWMDIREVRQAMYNSYPSIRTVVLEFYKLKEATVGNSPV